jgi:Ca-activated chloride channel family protein
MNRPLAVAVSVSCIAAGARSQGVDIAQSAGVSVAQTTVRAAIVDGAATTRIEQRFHNAGARPAEATWLLPLPEGAVADGLELRVGDQVIAGEVLDAAAARGVYESIVRQRRDPALLEYVGEGLLRARVFPIPANGDATLQVRLRQQLPQRHGLCEWVLPLRALQANAPGAGPTGVEVAIESQTPLETVFASRSDADIVWRERNAARVSFEFAGRSVLDRDLRVLYGLAEAEFGLHLLPWRKAGAPGYFAMLLSPRRELPAEQVPSRCAQFVIDVSGSMAGPKLDQAKAALRRFVAGLRPVDRFQIVSFATDVAPLFPAPRAADAAAVRAALERIDGLQARGGTNIGEALATAFAGAPQDGGELSQVVFVTDGVPTVGLTDPRAVLDSVRRPGDRTRLFVFGVGDDVNALLLDDLAHQHGGSRDFVRPGEAIDDKVGALCTRIAQPVLGDVEVRCDAIAGFDVAPHRVPDLFCGDTLELVGRYQGTGKATVVVRGVQCGKVREFAFPVEFPERAERYDFVPVAWARRQIATMLDAIRHGGPNQELVDSIRDLARQYGIATPYTSQLIVEEGVRLGAAPRPRPSGPGGPSGPTTPGPGGPGPAGPAGVARGPTTGSRGVQLSEDVSDDFHLGSARRGARDTGSDPLRRAGGRVFVRVGDTWVETGLPADWAARADKVAAFSKEWFALADADPDVKAAFALGLRVAAKVGDRIVLTTAD